MRYYGRTHATAIHATTEEDPTKCVAEVSNNCGNRSQCRYARKADLLCGIHSKQRYPDIPKDWTDEAVAGRELSQKKGRFFRDLRDVRATLESQLRNQLESQYYDELPDAQAARGALNGIVSILASLESDEADRKEARRS